MKEFNLNEYLKNPSQKVVTRDGREVRIICTDAKHEFPVIGLVLNKKYNNEDTYNFAENGRWTYINEDVLDLFFAPIKQEGWVNLYKIGTKFEFGNVYNTEEEALNKKSNQNYVATIKIEWEE